MLVQRRGAKLPAGWLFAPWHMTSPMPPLFSAKVVRRFLM